MADAIAEYRGTISELRGDGMLVLFGAPVVIDRIASPLFEHVGELWNRGDVKPAHEHLVSATIQGLFGGVLEAADPSGVAPGIVVTTPAGQTHEFGALFAAATAASEGWRVTYLGPDLPADDIATAVIEGSVPRPNAPMSRADCSGVSASIASRATL